MKAVGVLDVFGNEPQGADDHRGHPAILRAQHLGFVERDTCGAYFEQAFEYVREYLGG